MWDFPFKICHLGFFFLNIISHTVYDESWSIMIFFYFIFFTGSGYQVCHLQPNYTNILLIYFLERNLFAKVWDKDITTIQKFTSGQCVWSFRIAAPQLVDWHWSADSFCWRKKKVVYRMGCVYTNIYSTMLLFHIPKWIYFKMYFLLQSIGGYLHQTDLLVFEFFFFFFFFCGKKRHSVLLCIHTLHTH